MSKRQVTGGFGMSATANLGLVAVQVLSSENSRLLTSPEDRNRITNDVANLWTVRWLPPVASDRPPNVAGASESTTILLYLLGISFASLVKPLFEEMVKEAGKDLWKGIKQLVAKIHKTQSDESYHLYSTIYVVLELRDEFVAFEFRMEGAKDETTEAEIERDLASQLSEIASSWDRINELIAKFHVGDKSATGRFWNGERSMIHLICRREEGGEIRWQIRGVESAEFFDSVHPRPSRYRK
jgi:hypothetical protein